jgi:thioredoxin reductase
MTQAATLLKRLVIVVIVVVGGGLFDDTNSVARIAVIVSTLVVVVVPLSVLHQPSGGGPSRPWKHYCHDNNNNNNNDKTSFYRQQTLLLADCISEWNSGDSDDYNNNVFSQSSSRSCCNNMSVVWDVVIVGGSSAGLSAALSLGRSLRRVLVVDANQPCNRFSTISSHNLLGWDGVSPSEIIQRSRDNIAQYPTVQIWDQSVVQQQIISVTQQQHEEDEDDNKNNNNNNKSFRFVVTILRQKEEQGSEKFVVFTRSLILATGVTDIVPKSILGLSDCWGKSVLHCPYCHGYEFRNQRTALWMNTKQLCQMAPILRVMTNDLCVVGKSRWYNDSTNNNNNNNKEERLLWEQLDSHNITVYEEDIVEIKHVDGKMTFIVLQNGIVLPMEALYIRPPMQQTFLPLIIQLSHNNYYLQTKEQQSQQQSQQQQEELVMDDMGYIQVDLDTQKTSIEGIMACGDCTTPNRALSIAIASGTKAAKMLNYELSRTDWDRG